MDSLGSFRRFTDELQPTGEKMPVLFVGHGSPMNGIEENSFTRGWKTMAESIPVPRAVVVISAHWLARGTRITAMDYPRTIHDFGGFPDELYTVQYPAPGDPALAREATGLVTGSRLELDHDWGLDHGAWTVVRHMYPDASIPVLQLSIDYTRGNDYHYRLAGELRKLREKGVLLMGSGNMVHNLRMVAWDRLDEENFGYDWALAMNDRFKTLISKGRDQDLIRVEQFGQEAKLAIPTPEHYWPLLYTLGLRKAEEQLVFFNDRAVGGSLTMTSVKFG